MSDETREVIGWELSITIAAPGVQEQVVRVETDDRLDLVPIGADDVDFERYGDEEDYVEIRASFIVKRELRPIFKEDEHGVETPSRPMTPDEIDAMQTGWSDDDRVAHPGGNA